MRLADIWDDVVRVGEAIGRAAAARALVAGFEERVGRLGRRSAAVSRRPTVLTIEWIDPIMIGGMWMPELVELAGGEPLVTGPGDHAPTLDRAALDALDPEVVLVKPCGFDIARTLEEVEALRAALPNRWRAVRDGRVFITDGSAYFNRPGPRILESLEILAACAQPDAFGDFAEKHARSIVRLVDGAHRAGSPER
jgi:iron complex transport system substrate-binding protein